MFLQQKRKRNPGHTHLGQMVVGNEEGQEVIALSSHPSDGKRQLCHQRVPRAVRSQFQYWSGDLEISQGSSRLSISVTLGAS